MLPPTVTGRKLPVPSEELCPSGLEIVILSLEIVIPNFVGGAGLPMTGISVRGDPDDAGRIKSLRTTA